jgi:hypothetical protein
MQLVNDAVFRRHVAYLFTVAFTVVLAVLPILDWIAARDFWGSVAAWLESTVPAIYRVLTAALSGLAWFDDELSRIPGWSWVTQKLGAALMAVKQFAPGWAAFWLESFANHPALFLFCAATAVAWLFFRKSQLLQDQIFARAEYAWRRI